MIKSPACPLGEPDFYIIIVKCCTMCYYMGKGTYNHTKDTVLWDSSSAVSPKIKIFKNFFKIVSPHVRQRTYYK